MVKTAGRILKSENIKLEGRFHLDIMQPGSRSPKRTTASSAAPKVRMLENHPEYAVIEVTCSCGARISVRCEYSDVSASAQNGAKT
jgi:hypothetical protein